MLPMHDAQKYLLVYGLAAIPAALADDAHRRPLARRDGSSIELRLALDTLDLLQDGAVLVVART